MNVTPPASNLDIAYFSLIHWHLIFEICSNSAPIYENGIHYFKVLVQIHYPLIPSPPYLVEVGNNGWASSAAAP